MVRPQSNCEKQSNPNNQEFDQQFYLPVRMKLHPTYLLILLSFELCIAKHLQQQDAGNRGEYTVACLRGHWQFKHFTWCHLTLHAIIRFIATVGSPWFFLRPCRIFLLSVYEKCVFTKKTSKDLGTWNCMEYFRVTMIFVWVPGFLLFSWSVCVFFLISPCKLIFSQQVDANVDKVNFVSKSYSSRLFTQEIANFFEKLHDRSAVFFRRVISEHFLYKYTVHVASSDDLIVLHAVNDVSTSLCHNTSYKAIICFLFFNKLLF